MCPGSQRERTSGNFTACFSSAGHSAKRFIGMISSNPHYNLLPVSPAAFPFYR